MWTLRSWAHRILGRRLHVPDIPVSLAGLAGRGFVPSLVFDVGAYRGDFAREVLDIWPSSRVACFEPLDKAADRIEKMRASHPGIALHRGLLGAEFSQEVAFNMAETASSVLLEHHSVHPVCKVAQWTIDSAVHDWYAGKAPDLLKLDVQGFGVYDTCGMTHRPLDGALWQIDMLFVPRHSALRSDKRWRR